MNNSILYIAWRSGDPNNGCWGPIGRLEFVEQVYRFTYTHGAKTLKDFTPFPNMENLEVTYESEELLPLFSNRLLGKNRREYASFLQWSGFDPANPPDPISLLSVTAGRRATDSFELFPHPLPDAHGHYNVSFFLHGVRWMDEKALDHLQKLCSGDELSMMLDFQNPVDPNAIAVRTSNVLDRMMLGYVPRYLTDDIHQLRNLHSTDLALKVKQANAEAPMQNRLLCSITSSWPVDFHPCSSPDFEPLANIHSMA